MTNVPRVLIVGGGFVGVYAALGLERRLGSGRVQLTMVSPESYMLYQPFLPEVASGTIEPRHAVVPLRDALKRTRLITGRVLSIDHGSRRAQVQPLDGSSYELAYDHVVVAVGSDPQVLDIPGLADCALGFTTISEATFLRNRVLWCLDLAESTTDPDLRRRALTFVVVGAGYSGVEALAELEDLGRDAARQYPTVKREEMRWILVEARGTILPEVGERLGSHALKRLREQDIEVHLNTRLESAIDGHVVLSDGTEADTNTLVWTAGVRADSLTGYVDWDLDERGRIKVDRYLRVRNATGAWAAGDCAAIPAPGGTGVQPPTAQHAVREGKLLARNLASTIENGELRPFEFSSLGLLVSLGRYRGVAQVMGVRVKGFPAWFLHRSYHLLMIPTLRRKVRVVADWSVALFFKRDIVQLDSLRHPRGALAEAFQKDRR